MKIFMRILTFFFFFFMLVALILYIAGVRGAVGISPSLRSYLNKVVYDTSSSTFLKIPSIPFLEFSSGANFWEFILNVGKVIVNMFLGVINVITWLWNVQVSVITFIVKLIENFYALKPEVFEINNNAWWWQEIGHSTINTL